ncbi:MAG: sodium:solute symporter, partial [Xenococcus sp. (in: cyanobacteria)]
MPSVSTLTIALIIIYLVIIKIVGYFAHRSSKETVEDYFVAGRNTGLIALIGTLTATKINGLALTAAPAFVYRGGILFAQTIIALGIASWLTVYFGPAIWKKAKEQNLITQAELFGNHYQSPIIYALTVIIGLVSVFPFLIVQFVAVGKVFSSATNHVVTYEQSVLLLAISTGIYVFFGGARAVIWTDVVQGLFFLTLILVSAILFTIWAGGLITGFVTLTEVIPEKLVFNRENTPIFFEQIFSWSFAYFLWPQIFQRVMMGRSEKIVKNAAWGNFAVGLGVKIALLIMGVMGTAMLYGQIQDSDRLVAQMFNLNFPLGGALIVLAVFACGMSSIDSILLSIASIFTRDIVEKFLQNSLSEIAEYKLAQVISVITLIMAVVLTLSDIGRGYLAPLVTFGATMATLLLWPTIGVFAWKNSTKLGVISAMCMG